MDIRPIDANALVEKLDNINPVDYGSMGSYETHNGAKWALSDAVMRVNDAPTLSLNTLRDVIYEDAVAHGLWEEHDEWCPKLEKQLNGTLSLIETKRTDCASCIYREYEELLDAVHNANAYAEELADVIIMSMSVAGKLGIDIDAAIRRKMEINKARPWKHEGEKK